MWIERDEAVYLHELILLHAGPKEVAGLSRLLDRLAIIARG